MCLSHSLARRKYVSSRPARSSRSHRSSSRAGYCCVPRVRRCACKANSVLFNAFLWPGRHEVRGLAVRFETRVMAHTNTLTRLMREKTRWITIAWCRLSVFVCIFCGSITRSTIRITFFYYLLFDSCFALDHVFGGCCLFSELLFVLVSFVPLSV